MKYDPSEINVHDPRYGPGGKSNLYYDAELDEVFVRPEREAKVAEALMREARKIAEAMAAEAAELDAEYERLCAEEAKIRSQLEKP